jgi:uncharacterized protein YlaN (UPF0358 family)
MFIEVERAEHALLLELIQTRIHELDAAVGRGVPEEDHGGSQIELLERLLHKLHEAEWEATC